MRKSLFVPPVARWAWSSYGEMFDVVPPPALPPAPLSLKVIVNLAGEFAFFEGTRNVIRFYGITSMLYVLASVMTVWLSSEGISLSRS